MRQRGVGEQALILQLVHHVHAIGEELLLYALEFVAQHHSLQFDAASRGKRTTLGEQLKAHIGHAALVILAIND